MRSAAVVHRPVLGSAAAFSPSPLLTFKFRAKTLPTAKFGGKSIRSHSASGGGGGASSSPSTSTSNLTINENHCRESFMLGRRAVLYMATLSFLPCDDFDKSICAGAADETFRVREEIRQVLSKGKAPGVLRLVFHDAGTFEMEENTGGMNGSIVYELDRPENKGLKKSVKILEKAKSELDGVQPVSWADIIAVAGAEAVSVCGGPKIPVQLGRIDSLVPDPEGKLPVESLDASAMKQCFQRKGFSTQELVALSGAHTIGGKGFGNPTIFDNSYFKILIEKPWLSSDGKSSMIGLPSDRALVEDDECIRWITKYANDESLFFEDFKNVYLKLVNSGATWRRSL